MRFFNGITSAFLAVIIANPLCCCFGGAWVDESVPQVSCCSHTSGADQEAPAPGTCPGCQSKNPRLADGSSQPVLKIDFPELALIPDFAPGLSIYGHNASLIAAANVPGTRPPRLLLVLQQRFLI